jgi:hypothetical protein
MKGCEAVTTPIFDASSRGAPGSPINLSPVELDHVEGVEKHGGVVAAVADAVEAGHAVVAAAHPLAVDDAGARAPPGERLPLGRAGRQTTPSGLPGATPDDTLAGVLARIAV